jgi:ribosomal protein L11 methylase PrmA
MDTDLGKLRGPFAGTAAHLDAPYVQSPQETIEAMLDLAELKAGEGLLDLGSGDGRIVLSAARRGAVALGVDIDPQRVEEAQETAAQMNLSRCASFRCEDLFATPLGDADVITLYLLAHVNDWLSARLRAKTRRGARIVSHAFPIKGWEPTATRRVGQATLYLWRV